MSKIAGKHLINMLGKFGVDIILPSTFACSIRQKQDSLSQLEKKNGKLTFPCLGIMK